MAFFFCLTETLFPSQPALKLSHIDGTVWRPFVHSSLFISRSCFVVIGTPKVFVATSACILG